MNHHKAVIDALEADQRRTARQIITARLGRDLGQLATMPTDLRKALYRLALELQRNKWRQAAC
jgi:hypothetical protein